LRAKVPQREYRTVRVWRWGLLVPVLMLVVSAIGSMMDKPLEPARLQVQRVNYPDTSAAIPARSFDDLLLAVGTGADDLSAPERGTEVLAALEELSEALASFPPEATARVIALLKKTNSGATQPDRPDRLLTQYLDYRHRLNTAPSDLGQPERESLQNEVFGKATAERLFHQTRMLWRQMQMQPPSRSERPAP